MILPLEAPLWLESKLLALRVDWCCHYGPNCLFKIGLLLDYICSGLLESKPHHYQKHSEMPLGLESRKLQPVDVPLWLAKMDHAECMLLMNQRRPIDYIRYIVQPSIWTGVAITAQIIFSKLAFVRLHMKWTT